MRREYEISGEQLNVLLDAGKPTPVMYLSGGVPMGGSPYDNAMLAWRALGLKMGFDYMSVQAAAGKSNRFFTAEETVRGET